MDGLQKNSKNFIKKRKTMHNILHVFYHLLLKMFGTGRGGHSLAGEGVGGLNSDEGTESVVL
jgi:hypothetical protein